MKLLLIFLLLSCHCFSQTIAKAKKEVRRQAEFSYASFNLKPVELLASWNALQGNTNLKNELVFKLRDFCIKDTSVQAEMKLYGDSSGVFFDIVSATLFKFQGKQYYDAVVIPYNAAPASRIDCFHFLFDTDLKQLTSFKSATESLDCYGDFDNDGMLDCMLFCWVCGSDFVPIRNISQTGETSINPNYKLGIKYNFEKYYYPMINRNTTKLPY